MMKNEFSNPIESTPTHKSGGKLGEAVGTGLITFAIDLLEPVFRIIFILSRDGEDEESCGRREKTDHLESSTIDKSDKEWGRIELEMNLIGHFPSKNLVFPSQGGTFLLASCLLNKNPKFIVE